MGNVVVSLRGNVTCGFSRHSRLTEGPPRVLFSLFNSPNKGSASGEHTANRAQRLTRGGLATCGPAGMGTLPMVRIRSMKDLSPFTI